jgi:hypothetical protein
MDARSDQRVSTRSAAAARWQTVANESPVFVDDSGRRARGVRLVGLAVAGLCALWLVGLSVGMAGFSGFPPRLPAHARVGLRPARTAPADRVADRAEIARRAGVAYRRGPELGADSRSRPSCPSSFPSSRAPGSNGAAPPVSDRALAAGRTAGRPTCPSPAGTRREARLT